MSHSFGKSPFSFNPPAKLNSSGSSKFGKDMLFNKKKISADVLSMSSASSSASSISSSASSVSSRSSEGTTTCSDMSDENQQQMSNNNYDKYEESSQKSFNDDDSDSDDNQSHVIEDEHERQNKYDTLRRDKKQAMLQEINQKREILYQMDRLESKGYRLPFKFNMESDLNEMQAEYNKLIREKEVDASIRFQRKMLMAFVTGTEYLNQSYNPFDIRLEGWSEQIHENITDYDDIFEELHVKYKSSGKKMSPELRLFISLSGSAFMFHLTSRMFKENPLPNVEQVLKSNPELMKQFQAAAAKQYIMGQPGPQPANSASGMGGMGAMGNGLFGMVSNLFNNLGGGPSRPQMTSFRDDDEISTSSRTQKLRRPQTASAASRVPHRDPNMDIDSIINNVHSKISFDQEQNNIETLSVSDEEITSIIEDTADIKILTNSKNKNKNVRTLNL